MALSDIFLALDRDAKSQNEETLARAKKEAKEVTDSAVSSAKLIMAEQVNRAQEELHSQESKIILEAKFRAKKSLVEQKETLINEVFTEADKRLKGLTKSKDFNRIFAELAREASAAIDSGALIEVTVAKDNLSEAKSIFGERSLQPTFKTTSNNLNGIIISLDGGRKVLTNTLESRLEVTKKKFRVSVGEMLFNA